MSQQEAVRPRIVAVGRNPARGQRDAWGHFSRIDIGLSLSPPPRLIFGGRPDRAIPFVDILVMAA